LDSYLTWNVGERKQKHQEISPDPTQELELSRKFFERIQLRKFLGRSLSFVTRVLNNNFFPPLNPISLFFFLKQKQKKKKKKSRTEMKA
jgi:hypothetical protein